MRETLGSWIQEIRNEHEAEPTSIQEEVEPIPHAEVVAAKAAYAYSRRVSDVERKRSQEIAAEVAQKIRIVEQQTKARVEAESLKLEAAKSSGDTKAIRY